jgi:pyruvate/2-oxoglutarate dehydrogenase complex dihydrolipoamide dehydrogenase (E3) component
MTDSLIDVHKNKYKVTGARLVMGSARFVGPKTLEVHLVEDENEIRIDADRVFLNLDTHASIPAVPGLAECDPLTHIELLELNHLPQYLVVVGGGFVGLEFAQALRRFGSEVTILQRGSHLLTNQDHDVSDEIRRILISEGIKAVTSAETVSVSGRSGVEVKLAIRTSLGEREVIGSDVLVAAGRTPNTLGMGLDVVGVGLDHRGYIKVNDRLETKAQDIWAIGECAGSRQSTHASLDDFRVIRDNLAGEDRSTRDRLIPSCLFTDPQVAHIGLTESHAKNKGIAVEVARLPVAAVLRTRTISETQGFMKALIDPEDGRIFGFTMVGAEAGEVMAVVQMAMQVGAPYTVLRRRHFGPPDNGGRIEFAVFRRENGRRR